MLLKALKITRIQFDRNINNKKYNLIINLLMTSERIVIFSISKKFHKSIFKNKQKRVFQIFELSFLYL